MTNPRQISRSLPASIVARSAGMSSFEKCRTSLHTMFPQYPKPCRLCKLSLIRYNELHSCRNAETEPYDMATAIDIRELSARLEEALALDRPTERSFSSTAKLHERDLYP